MKKLSVLIWCAVVAALAPLLLVLGVYLSNFHSSELAREPTPWGLFGDYVGGTLGAIYGLLAFLGVLVTIHVQRQRTELEELQRLLASVSKAIDEMLDAPPREMSPKLAEFATARSEIITVRWILAGASMTALRKSRDAAMDAIRNHFTEDTVKSIRYQIGLINAELHQLVWCLRRFEAAGGSDAVVLFYRLRYSPIVMYEHSIGLARSPVLQEYFDPEGLVRRYGADAAGEAAQPTSSHSI